MELRIHPITGPSIKLSLAPSTSIFSLRCQLQSKLSLNASQYRLLYNRKPLIDNLTLSESSILPGSTIEVVYILSSGFDVFAKLSNEKTIVLSVLKSHLIYELKSQIQDKEGLLESQQTLVYQDNVLSDNDTVEACGIQKESTITVRITDVSEHRPKLAPNKPPLPKSSHKFSDISPIRGPEDMKLSAPVTLIFHTFARRTALITVYSFRISISEIKEKLYQRKNIPIDNQWIYTDKRELSDDMILANEVRTGDTQSMLLLVRATDSIQVQFSNGDTVRIHLTGGLVVSAIRDQIRRQRAWKSDTFFLYHEHRLLTDASEVLTELTSSSVLRVSMTMRLYVRDLGGFVKDVYVQDSESIAELTVKISVKFGIPSHDCSLTFHNSQLTTEKLWQIPGLQSASVIHLRPSVLQ